MKQSKFEKKAQNAKTEKLCKMYIDRLEYDPSEKNGEKLQILSDRIPDQIEDDILFRYYDNAMGAINNEKYKMLTGFGQCRGKLVTYRGNIILCCCQELAMLIAFRGAHADGGKLCFPGMAGSASHFRNSVYVVNDDESLSLPTCPFCGAALEERADFTDSENRSD